MTKGPLLGNYRPSLAKNTIVTPRVCQGLKLHE
jgi:hypothetical protein